MPFGTKKLRDLLGCNDLRRIFAGEEAVVRASHKAHCVCRPTKCDRL